MQSLNYDYVSDEENGVGVSKGKWVVRRLTWRSERASGLMEQLQQRINNSQQEDLRPRVPRVEGAPSERQLPRHNVAWALADTEPATGGEHSAEEEDDERNNHTPTPRQHSTPVTIVQRSDNRKRRREHRHAPRSPRRQRRAVQSDSE